MEVDTENVGIESEECEMFETTVTLVGRLITPLKQIRFADGTFKVTGRMVSTERRFDRATGQWVDGRSLFLAVVCKRTLAENAFLSLRSGDPVVAHGRLYTREYEKEGVTHRLVELEARSIAPDLQFCTTAVTRKSRASVPAADEPVWEGGVPDDLSDLPDGEGDELTAEPTATEDPWSAPEVRGGEAAVGV